MKKYLNIVSIFLIWLIYILGASYLFKGLGIIAWTHHLGQFAPLFSIIIQEVPMIIILLILNHFFWHQKILFKRYNWKKSLGVLVIPLFMLISGLVSALTNHQRPSYILLAIFATLLIGIAEELSFRGLIFGILVKNTKDKIILPLFTSSILFGLIHLVNLHHQPLVNTLIQALSAIAFGLFAATVYLKTNNLIFAILLHAMNDFAALAGNSGSLSSPQTNPLTVIFEWFILGTLAFSFFYTGWLQREKFIASLKERSPRLETRELPALATNSTFRRIFALLSMLYGLAILPTIVLFAKGSASHLTKTELINKMLPLYILFLLAISLYVFLIIFFNFHLGNLCWLLFPYIGGPIFALLALVKGAIPLHEKMKQSKKSDIKTPN